MRQLLLVICLLAPIASFAAPRDWNVIVRSFENVFKPHPGCVGAKRVLSEMECSNFRARALTRFQHEWEANSFWREGRFVENETAGRRVNSELPR